MNRIALSFVFSVSFFVVGCDSGDECGVPGTTQQCFACGPTIGSQVCAPSGDWGPCLCGDIDAGRPDSGGVDSGSVDSGPVGTDAAMPDSGPPPPSCTDGVQNQDESDVDCGGTCGGCSEGSMCGTNEDCRLELCTDEMICDAPPRLISSMPSMGAGGVAPDAVITARFSEALDPESVNVGSFVVAREGDFGTSGNANAVPGTVELAGDTITFTPDGPLDLATTYDIFMGFCGRVGEAPNGATLVGCRSTILDTTGNRHAGARVTFDTLVEAPGAVRVNSGGSRVYQMDLDGGLNAAMFSREGAALRLIHEGGGLYLLRDEGAGVDLARRSTPGGTDPGDIGATEVRNAEFSDRGTRFRLMRRVDGPLPYFFIVDEDGYELATGRGGNNLQWQQGAAGNSFRFVR